MVNPDFLDALGDAMGAVYRDCVERIIINLARHFQLLQPGEDPGGSFEYQAKKLAQMGQVTQETVRIIRETMRGADEALKDCLEAAIKEALHDLEPELRQAALDGLINGGTVLGKVDPRMMRAFQMYYQQAADKMNLVNTVMLESTQNAYYATVSDIVARIQTAQSILNMAAGQVVTGVESMNKAVRIATNRMVKNGLTGFIDHAGRRWRPETYIAMDMRTTFHNASREAFFESNERYGHDYYLVSQHPGARPLCYPWQCKVITRTGPHGWTTDGKDQPVEVWAQSETSYGEPAGLFGINCGHHPQLFLPGATMVPEVVQNEQENAEAYAESQRHRALERDMREAQLQARAAKARRDPEAVRAAQNDLVRANQNLQDFLDETGRKRRTEREYTPVNATWPDPETYGSSPTKVRDMINEYFKRR